MHMNVCAVWSSCLNALYGNLCVFVCARFHIVFACTCVCGVWCHHLGCVVVDSRLHTPGKSVITQASAHTHCKLVQSVVLALFFCLSLLSSSLSPHSVFLSPKVFLCDSQCGPSSGLAMKSVSCVLEFGMCLCFQPIYSHAHSGNTHTHTHQHTDTHEWSHHNVMPFLTTVTQPTNQLHMTLFRYTYFKQ